MADRRAAKKARRARRLTMRGPARRHWERRRKGMVGSAPQLKHRSAGADDDRLISTHRNPHAVKLGYRPTAVQIARFRGEQT